jgi:hypothetical protein
MKPKDPQRNQPTKEGRSNDPNLRDESAIQPGNNTVSNSDYDDDNEEITKTAADDFRKEDDSDAHTDPSFDEVDYD